MISSKIVN
jgi:CheY-like chemotaxis protein